MTWPTSSTSSERGVYLLDTSVASIAVNIGSTKHAAVQRFIAGTPLFADQIFLSVVTVAEIHAGVAALAQKVPPVARERIEEIDRRAQLIGQLGTILPVTTHIAKEHATIKIAYARKYAPALLQKAALKSKPVELWHEGLVASSLQVTENDLWIAATAIAHDLTLLTADGDHLRMKEADPRLQVKAF